MTSRGPFQPKTFYDSMSPRIFASKPSLKGGDVSGGSHAPGELKHGLSVTHP